MWQHGHQGFPLEAGVFLFRTPFLTLALASCSKVKLSNADAGLRLGAISGNATKSTTKQYNVQVIRLVLSGCVILSLSKTCYTTYLQGDGLLQIEAPTSFLEDIRALLYYS